MAYASSVCSFAKSGMEKNTNKRPVTFTGRLFVCQAMLGLIVYVVKGSTMYLYTGKNIKIDWVCLRQISDSERGSS